MEDLAPYPRLSYEQGEHNSFYFSEEILSTLDSKAEGGLAGAGRADDGRGGLFRDGEADVVQNLTVIVAKAHMSKAMSKCSNGMSLPKDFTTAAAHIQGWHQS